MAVSEPGASFVQVIEPRTGTKDFTGLCLRFAQSVFGAPVAHRSATDAANLSQQIVIDAAGSVSHTNLNAMVVGFDISFRPVV